MGLEIYEQRRHNGGHIREYEAFSAHKHHFSIIFQEIIPRDKSFAAHWASFSSKDGYEKMEMNVTKVKEVFVNITPWKRTSFRFYIGIIDWEICNFHGDLCQKINKKSS